MSRPLPVLLALSLVTALACGGASAPAEPPPVEAPAVQVLWEVVPDPGATPSSTAPFATIEAGNTQGLLLDQTVTLLGPAPAVGGAQPIVGSARVTEVGPESARLIPLRLAKPLPPSLAARPLAAEDQGALAAIPEVPALAKKAATATPAAEVPSPSEAAIPEDLRTGSSKQRIDALVRYETRSDMTDAIVWVMKHDDDADVRMKAWRVLRARWKRGVGEYATNEAAAVWAAANGSQAMRVEALDALGERGRNITPIAGHLDDPSPSIRIAAAKAVAFYGPRAGEKPAAKRLLQARKSKETDDGVRKKIAALLDEL